MKVYVMHDAQGKIGGTFVSTRDNVGVNAMAGMKLHTFDHEPLEGDALKQYLRELHATHRVVEGAEGPSLMKLKQAQ